MYKIPANTLFMGQHLVFMPECHSTNDVIQQLIGEKGLTEGMVVITGYQSAGRGQRGNTWVVEPNKNITFSLALKPVFLRARQHFLLNIFTSLAVADLLKNLLPGEAIRIKWPNDIMIGVKKVCGILIENQVSGHSIHESIVGIGLNVNQRDFVIDTATSVARVAGNEFNLNDVFHSLMEFLESRYLQLKSGNDNLLRQHYAALLFRKDETHLFRIGDQQVMGIIRSVDEDGLLLVEIDAMTRKFNFKEIIYSY